MPWSGGSGSPLVHSGTNKDTYVFGLAMRDGLRLEAQCRTTADSIRFILYSSQDGRIGWECGIMTDSGASGSNLTIRRVIEGTPSAPVVTAAHGVTAGVPFILRAEVFNGNIIISVLGDNITQVNVTHANNIAPTFRLNEYIGLVSDVNGAQVGVVVPFYATFTGEDENEILVLSADGDVWMSLDGREPSKIGSKSFLGNDTLSMGQMGGVGYIVGEGRARKVDPTTRAVSDWSPQAMPGSTGPGTTSATICLEYFGCIVVAVPSGPDRGVYFSAVGDPENFVSNPGYIDASAPFVLGPGSSYPIGEDIVTVYRTSADTLIIACQFSTYIVRGHPVFGNISQVPATLDSGSSGQNAIASIDVSGQTYMHSPDGGIVLNNTGPGGSYNHTRNLIRAGLSFSREERVKYQTTLIRDPRRAWMMILLTRKDTGNGLRSLHWIYDERAGYDAANGGMYAIQFATDAMDPYCAINWFGRPIFGCRDGFIRQIEPTQDAKDDGVAFAQELPLSLIDAEGLIEPIRLTTLFVQGTRQSSDIRMKVFGGYTAEDVFDPTARRHKYTTRSYKGANNAADVRCIQTIEDNALLAVLLPHFAGQKISLEYADAKIELGAMRHQPTRLIAKGGDLCTPYAAPLPIPATDFEACEEPAINPPPPPVGACTIGANCSIKTQAACLALGGSWAGAGTTCPIIVPPNDDSETTIEELPGSIIAEPLTENKECTIGPGGPTPPGGYT
jgi:hypothetical protein